jgi:triosephosphate isomerase
MRRALIAANWKMHGSRKFVNELVGQLVPLLADSVKGVDLILCPPFPYLAQVQEMISGAELMLGAQNLSAEHEGAYTGEISARMLADCNVRYVIVGHSERRALMAENNALVALKFAAAQDVSLIPILCVGEMLADRESGNAAKVVEQQLLAVLNSAGAKAFENAVVAYEPIWAIGTGRSASTAQAQEMHASIRRIIAERDPEVAQKVQIVYGGSVNPDNASDLFSQPDIDGGLIGGASLNAQSFTRICQSVS